MPVPNASRISHNAAAENAPATIAGQDTPDEGASFLSEVSAKPSSLRAAKGGTAECAIRLLPSNQQRVIPKGTTLRHWNKDCLSYKRRISIWVTEWQPQMWMVGSDPHNSKTREALRVADGSDNIAEGVEGGCHTPCGSTPKFLHPGNSVERLMAMRAARSKILFKLINRNVGAAASRSASWRPRRPPSGCRPTAAADRPG
jgi:hypothetical protein